MSKQDGVSSGRAGGIIKVAQSTIQLWVVHSLLHAPIAETTLAEDGGGAFKLCIVSIAATSPLHEGLCDEILHPLCAAAVTDISEHMMEILQLLYTMWRA